MTTATVEDPAVRTIAGRTSRKATLPCSGGCGRPVHVFLPVGGEPPRHAYSDHLEWARASEKHKSIIRQMVSGSRPCWSCRWNSLRSSMKFGEIKRPSDRARIETEVGKLREAGDSLSLTLSSRLAVLLAPGNLAPDDVAADRRRIEWKIAELDDGTPAGRAMADQLRRMLVKYPAVATAAVFDPGPVLISGLLRQAETGVPAPDIFRAIDRHRSGDFGLHGRLADVRLTEATTWDPDSSGPATVNAMAIRDGEGVASSCYGGGHTGLRVATRIGPQPETLVWRANEFNY